MRTVAFYRGLLGCLSILLCLNFAHAQEKPSGAQVYRVQPGDLLEVSVWREPDLQREVLVQPDGNFSFPLAGDFVAQGKSVTELRRELRRRLAGYVPDLVVTVTVKKASGNRMYVLGQVEQPGEFVMDRPVDVMQALSMAGGTTAYASLNAIKVLRRQDDEQISIPFSYKDVLNGRALEQNIILRSGDIVVVP